MTNFRRSISIRIRSNKNGKRIAHYWGEARRWLPMSIAEAELALATGQWGSCKAVRAASTSDLLPVGYVYTSVDGDIFS